METSVLPAAGSDIASPRPDRGRFARCLLGLEVGLCIGAAGGAWYLIAEPHTAMLTDYLARTPFSSWIVPGLLLALCVALPAGVVAFGTATRRTYAHAGHPVLGLTLMGWIVVQLIVLGPMSLLQPAMFVWGLVILLLGAANYRRWHTGWGATAAERSAELAGDELMIRAHFVATVPSPSTRRRRPCGHRSCRSDMAGPAGIATTGWTTVAGTAPSASSHDRNSFASVIRCR